MPMHQKGDAGPYHTMTCAMKGLNGDFYDITFTKNKFHDPKHMSFSAHKHHHLEAMACEYEEKNLRAPVIVILGHHPAFYLVFLRYDRHGQQRLYDRVGVLEGTAAGYAVDDLGR